MKNLRRLIWVLLGVVAAILFVNLGNRASARDYWHYGDNAIDGCRDIEYIFVRGSGQEQNEGAEWKEFETRMAEVSKYAHVSYRATDLDYPAVAITLNNVLGIYSSAGAATNFAESVWTGVIKLRDYVRHRSEACANSYFVLGGYSQGA
ncbi:MAG: cutinase family protein, partial [Candidatus Saccharibacteria bacterium]|nr:cutinase family protein [Candidatus Saccharibacteria bacterium]